MAFSSCLCNSQILLEIDHSRLSKKLAGNIRKDQLTTFALKGMNTVLFGQHAVSMRSKLKTEWSFKGGSRAFRGPTIQRFVQHRKSSGVYASWFTNLQIASSVFTLGTVAVLPFYTLMVLAPKAELVCFAPKFRPRSLLKVPFHMLCLDFCMHFYSTSLGHLIQYG